MTNQQSKNAWHALQPKGTVRFSSTGSFASRRDTEDDVSEAYLAEHTRLTEVGEKFYYTYCGRHFA